MFQTLIRLDGQKFGKWTVLSHAGGRHWVCRCDCGATHAVSGSALRGGRTRACKPCGTRESGLKSRHGMTSQPLWNSWQAMKSRCYKVTDIGYHNYGGRGIKVCDQWLESFETFRDWALTNGYEEGLSVDRIENDGDYTPGNCRWATAKEQSRNQRTTIRIEVSGEIKPLTEWAELKEIPASVIRNRIAAGWTPQEAVTRKYMARRPA